MKASLIAAVLLIALSTVFLAACATVPPSSLQNNVQDSAWQGRGKLRAWTVYSDRCRISRKLFLEIGKSLNYYITADDDEKILYLIFEDTHSFADAIHDIAFVTKSYEHGSKKIKAHGGFVKVWHSGSEQVMKEFFEQVEKYPDYEIVFVGWSMGGAIAHLAAEEFNFRTRTDEANPDSGRKVVLITYGCPNLLYGKDMRDYFERCVKAAYNFANVKDPFAKLPPVAWNFFVIRRIEVGQNYKGKKHPHLSYGQKEIYKDIVIDEPYVQVSE